MKDNEKIEDNINEASQPASQPKPLRKLKRVDAGRTSAGGNQQYQGRYETPHTGNYQGRYAAESERFSEREEVRRHPNRRPPVREELNIPIKRTEKKKSAKDIIVKTIAVIASLSIIIALVLTMPIMWWDKKGVKERVSIMTYFVKRQQPLVHIEGELDKSTEKVDVSINTNVLPEDYNDGLDFMEQWIEGQYTVLFLGFDVDSLNTDVIWLCQFDLKGGALRILQIPRDTAVPDFTSSPSTKINSVYSSGDPQYADIPIQRVVDCVQQNFGIPIDAYITTYITDIAEMVDLVGGIPISLDEPIHYEEGKTIEAGDTILTGEQSEWFIRYRYGWLEGDIGRMQNQRRFMAAAMQKLMDISKNEGTAKLKEYIDEVMDRELIATDMMVVDLTRLADFCGTIPLESVQVDMVPGESTSNEEPYIGSDGIEYSIYSIHKQETLDLLNKYYRPYQNPLTGYGDTAIIEYIKEHNYSNYDDKTATFDDLIDSEAPARDPNKVQ